MPENRFTYLLVLLFFLFSGIKISLNAQCNFSQGPVGELCTSAIYICGSDLDGYTSRLPDKLSADQIWPILCGGNGTADNIVWFSFTPCSPKVTLRITPSNCTVVNVLFSGIQAGFFEACNKNASVACTDHTNNNGITTPFDLTYDKFKPGQTVFLFLDGYAKSVCDFRIDVIEGIDTQPVVAPDPRLLIDGAITGPDKLLCTDRNIPVTYNLVAPECKIAYNSACNIDNSKDAADSLCYIWQISPATGRYFESQDSTGKNVNIVFTEPGTYTIKADPYLHPFYGGSCASGACGDILSWQVVVASPDTLIRPVELVCPGRFVDFCGNRVIKDTVIYCYQDDCTYIRQEFKFGTSKLNLLGTQYICSGSMFLFQGVGYNTPGDYEIIDANDCSLVHRFRIESVEVNVSVQASVLTLNCNFPESTIQALGWTNAPGSLTYSWRDGTGNTLSSLTPQLMVDKPGRYHVRASYSTSGEICYAETYIDIGVDFAKPKVTATLPTVRCRSSRDPKPFIIVQTNDVLTFTEWTTPLGAKMNGLNIELDSLNVITGRPYIFTSIAANGCRLDTSFVITSNFEKAVIQLKGSDLTCYKPKDTLLLSTNISIDSIRWSKSSPSMEFYGSYSSKVSHEITAPGIYRVEVMASSSKCWSDETIGIEDKIIYPDVSVNTGLKWHCNTTQIDITPVATDGQQILYRWTTANGNILSDPIDKRLRAGAPGLYQISVTDISNGCSKSGFLTIEKETNIPQSINFDAQDILCYGQNNGNISINATVGGFSPYEYYINGERLNGLLKDKLKPGDYLLEVRDKYDCVHQVAINIAEPPLFEISTEPEISIAFNDVAELEFLTDFNRDEITHIVWTNSKGEVLGRDFELNFQSNYSDIIHVEVTTINGCISRAMTKVNVDNELKIYYPNIFSPNGDGVNDRLEFFRNKVSANIDKISIYDRYGNNVYTAHNFDFETNENGWDGTFKGKPVEVGVYIMIIQLTDFAGQKILLKKDLTLIR